MGLLPSAWRRAGPSLRTVWMGEGRTLVALLTPHTHLREAARWGSPRAGSENRPPLRGWGSGEGPGRKAWWGWVGPHTKGSVCKVEPCTCPNPPPATRPGGGACASHQGGQQIGHLFLVALELAQKAFGCAGVQGWAPTRPHGLSAEARAPNRGWGPMEVSGGGQRLAHFPRKLLQTLPSLQRSQK